MEFNVPHAVEPRVFRLIKSLGAYERSKKGNADIGGCDHISYDLDERWSKVLCQNCGVTLEAFDVLCRYQEWADRITREKEMRWTAERNLLTTQLRLFYRQRRFTDEEKAQMKPYLAGGTHYPAQEPKALRELVYTLGRKAGVP